MLPFKFDFLILEKKIIDNNLSNPLLVQSISLLGTVLAFTYNDS